MDWRGLGETITSMGASLLGGAVAGPAGAKVAGGLVARLWGADPDDPSDIATKMTADPEAAIKLQELENRHQERLEELSLEETKAHLADVASARQREVETTKATGERDWNLYVLAYIVVLGFFALCFVLMKYKIQQNDVVFMLFGGLATGFGTVLQYFFGSSKSSTDKTKLLATKSEK